MLPTALVGRNHWLRGFATAMRARFHVGVAWCLASRVCQPNPSRGDQFVGLGALMPIVELLTGREAGRTSGPGAGPGPGRHPGVGVGVGVGAGAGAGAGAGESAPAHARRVRRCQHPGASRRPPKVPCVMASSAWQRRRPRETRARTSPRSRRLRPSARAQPTTASIDERLAGAQRGGGGSCTAGSNLARWVAKKLFTLRTLASCVNSRCTNAW